MAFYEVDGLIRKEMRTGKSGAEALEWARAIVELHDRQEAK